MSVRPVKFNEDGSIDVILDETGHSGTIPADQVRFHTSSFEGVQHRFIDLICPDGCGTWSMHPASGGAATYEVQEMFVRKVKRDGCVCGLIVPGRNDGVPEAHVHLIASRQEAGLPVWKGSGRPKPGDPPPVGEQAPNTFQVVYRTNDRMVIGESPAGGVGPDNRVAVIRDMAEYDVLMKTDPAYVSKDGDHIVATPGG